jgi:argininosuccinate lyase
MAAPIPTPNPQPPTPPAREGRLRGGFAPEVADEVMADHQRDQARHFAEYMRVHRAHTVMLAECGIIAREDAAAILRALDAIEAGGLDALAMEPGADDLYLTTEARLIERVGADVGGRMHTGRSRNDLDATVTRLAVRVDGQGALEAALELGDALLARAEQHAHAIMPGFTHVQHAQPITLGHYLLAVLDMLFEDIERIEAALDRANRSPLGAAALAGTGFPINRARTATLLGFDGLAENTLTAVSSRQYAMEFAAALAIMAGTISRLGNEFFLWTTQEFGYAEIADAYAGTSSIMPQKKNPLVLETIRARSATVSTDLAAMIEIFRGLPLGYNFDSYEAQLLLWRTIDRARGLARMMAGVTRTITFREDRMRVAARRGFAAATEVADTLVRDAGLSFRQAHRVLATVVAKLAADGLEMDAADASMLAAVATEVLGRPVSLSDDALRGALDPATNIERRATTGGPAPAEVQRMLEERRTGISAAHARAARRRERDQSARALLAQAVAAVES